MPPTRHAVLLAALALVSSCSDERSNCSEVGGTWSMTFRPSDWNGNDCPALAALELSAPTANATQCHTGCTCSFGEFRMHSEHDESDYCGAPFQESCAESSSTMSCGVDLTTNTQATGFCRMTFSSTDDWCDYFVDFVKH